MDNQEPVTETIKASEARQRWSALLTEVGQREKRVIVRKSGTPVAAIISFGDFRRFERFDQRQRDRFKIMEEYSESFKDVPVGEIEREVAQAIQEVREENRRAAQQRQELAGVLDRMRSAFRDLPPDEIEREFDRVVLEERTETRRAIQRSSV